MSHNIYRVRFDYDLDEIITEQKHKLILVSYSSNTSKYFNDNKILLKKIAGAFKNIFVVYIDLNDFSDIKYKYIANLNSIPKYNMYFNEDKIATMEGFNVNSMLNIIEDIYSKAFSNKFPEQTQQQQYYTDQQPQIPQQIPQQTQIQDLKPQLEENINNNVELLPNITQVENNELSVTNIDNHSQDKQPPSLSPSEKPIQTTQVVEPVQLTQSQQPIQPILPQTPPQQVQTIQPVQQTPTSSQQAQPSQAEIMKKVAEFQNLLRMKQLQEIQQKANQMNKSHK